jgi:hypothetical protein
MMSIDIAFPVVAAMLGLGLVELICLAAYLAWRTFRAEAGSRDLAERADMQGDALREALNEIDRYRRLPGRGR